MEKILCSLNVLIVRVETFLFDSNHRELNLFGEFNQENASGAFKAAETPRIKSQIYK